MSRLANGRIRIGNQGACSLTVRFRRMPAHRPAKSKKTENPLTTIQQI